MPETIPRLPPIPPRRRSTGAASRTVRAPPRPGGWDAGHPACDSSGSQGRGGVVGLRGGLARILLLVAGEPVDELFAIAVDDQEHQIDPIADPARVLQC